MKENNSNPIEPHSMKCPKLYGEECQCDGYHTFDELYDHRITLWIALCKHLSIDGYPRRFAWRSKKHSDNEVCFGTGTQFLLGLEIMEGKQITYHIPIERWNETDFCIEMEKAPEFDGHTSDDVLQRIKNL